MTVNVAIVGLGKMGIVHSGIVNSIPRARVKSICETESFLLKVGRNLLPETVTLYKNQNEMIKKEEIDAVFVTTPIDTHLQLILDILNENKSISVFVEKPLAATGEEARKACEVVRNLHGVYMVGYQKRFSPIFQKARDLIKNNALGEPVFFKASSFSSDVLREGSRSWRFKKRSGGVLLDLASHLLDLLIWFFDEPVSVDSAEKKGIYSTQVEDYVQTTVSYRSGLKGAIEACWSMQGYRLPEIVIEVHGGSGALTVTDDSLRIVDQGGGGKACGERVFYRQSFDTSVPFLLGETEHTKEDQEFLSCVERRTIPEVSFQEAARVNDLIERINHTAQER